jgi:hypothetical protein
MAIGDHSKSLLIMATQIFVSFGLLGWLIQRFDFADVVSIITAINPLFFWVLRCCFSCLGCARLNKVALVYLKVLGC